MWSSWIFFAIRSGVPNYRLAALLFSMGCVRFVSSGSVFWVARSFACCFKIALSSGSGDGTTRDIAWHRHERQHDPPPINARNPTLCETLHSRNLMTAQERDGRLEAARARLRHAGSPLSRCHNCRLVQLQLGEMTYQNEHPPAAFLSLFVHGYTARRLFP